jgi:hypothetical protein
VGSLHQATVFEPPKDVAPVLFLVLRCDKVTLLLGGMVNGPPLSKSGQLGLAFVGIARRGCLCDVWGTLCRRLCTKEPMAPVLAQPSDKGVRDSRTGKARGG